MGWNIQQYWVCKDDSKNNIWFNTISPVFYLVISETCIFKNMLISSRNDPQEKLGFFDASDCTRSQTRRSPEQWPRWWQRLECCPLKSVAFAEAVALTPGKWRNDSGTPFNTQFLRHIWSWRLSSEVGIFRFGWIFSFLIAKKPGCPSSETSIPSVSPGFLG